MEVELGALGGRQHHGKDLRREVPVGTAEAPERVRERANLGAAGPPVALAIQQVERLVGPRRRAGAIPRESPASVA